MVYLLISIVCALIFIMGPSILGAAISRKKNYAGAILSGFVLSIVYVPLFWLIMYKSMMGIYGPTTCVGPILCALVFGAAAGGLGAGEGKGALPGLVLFSLYLVLVLLVLLGGEVDWWNSKSKAALIGEVEVVEGTLSDTINPADPAHMVEVPPNRAFKAAHAALSEFVVGGGAIAGSRYKIGDPTVQFVNEHLWYIYPVEFRGWLKWREERQVPGFLRVSAEDSLMKGQAVQQDKQGENIHIKYLNSACWEYRAERHLRMNGYMTAIFREWTYEVDDNWRPYYTVSVLERVHGWSAYKLKGIVTLDLQTGDHKFYSVDELPEWVDRAAPLNEQIDYHVKKWGLYANSRWWRRILKGDLSQKPTDGWYMVYDHKAKRCAWYSGFTSMKEDLALTGFILSDTRTGKTTFYKTQGVTEEEVYLGADALWPEATDVKPAWFIPYNIHGLLTYVMPMTQGDQFVGFSLIDLSNTIKARGKTFDEAWDAYAEVCYSADRQKTLPGSGEQKVARLQGRIKTVNLISLVNSSAVYGFTIEGVDKIFKTSYSQRNPEVAAIAVGEDVEITYPDRPEKVITCQTFDILSIEPKQETPEQVRYVEAKEVSDPEIERIQDRKETRILLNDPILKEADPNVLREFIEAQRKKKE